MKASKFGNVVRCGATLIASSAFAGWLWIAPAKSEPEFPLRDFSDIEFGDFVEYKVEVGGWFWLRRDEAFLTANQPSARPPFSINIAALSDATQALLKTRCSSPDQFRGGCNVTVRGEIKKTNRQFTIRTHSISLDEGVFLR